MKKAATSSILVTVILFAVTVIAEAQQPRKVPRIGLLIASFPSPASPRVEAFRQGIEKAAKAALLTQNVKLLGKGEMAMFDKERFIEDCRAALKERDTHAAVRELVARAVSEPTQIVRALGEPRRAGVETLYKADDLTILNLCWGPKMKFKPHDHRMWAVIGFYGGCEQNLFYQGAEYGLKQHGSKELHAKDAVPLGAAIIHAVTNPLDRLTAAIHVYGGDFFATPRSEWDPESFEERPYDVADTLRAFEKANERLRKMVSQP